MGTLFKDIGPRLNGHYCYYVVVNAFQIGAILGGGSGKVGGKVEGSVIFDRVTFILKRRIEGGRHDYWKGRYKSRS